MTTMRAVQVREPNGPFELVERKIPEPPAGWVGIKVEACGVCHSDSLVKLGLFPGIQYPRVPGHEVAGVIDAVGAGVVGWRPGQRVGVGWYGGHCGACLSCRRGDFIACANMKIAGVSYDGGYADYMLAPAEALALIPDELAAEDAAPLLCAGITTFNALRNSGARAGDVVAVLGIGGLGHLGVQFAAKMGFHTVAIARGRDKEALAVQLGARHYIDSREQDVAGELLRLGGAKVILSTVTSTQAVGAALGGLGVAGRLVIVGVLDAPLPVDTLRMLMTRQSIVAWPSGSAIDSEDTLNFGKLSGVRPMIEKMPLARASEAFDRMMSGAARFRMVLTTGR